MRTTSIGYLLLCVVGCAAKQEPPLREPSAAEPETLPVATTTATASPKSPPPDVELAVQRAVSDLEPVAEPGAVLKEGMHQCSKGTCSWKFDWVRPGDGGTRLGTIEVVDGTKNALFSDNGPLPKKLPVADYLKWVALARKVVGSVAESAEGRALCTDAKRARLECITSLDTPGAESCPASAALDDPCLWVVWVGASGPEGMGRWRTFLVDPSRLQIRGVSSDLCGSYSVAFFSKNAARIGKTEDREQCPKEPAR